MIGLRKLGAAVAVAAVCIVFAGCPPESATGSLRVVIAPEEAVLAGAQWQVDGGDWQDSGATVSGLTAGEHAVSYKALVGWAVVWETVSVTAGQPTAIEAEYGRGGAMAMFGGVEFAWCPPGTFLMGSDTGQIDEQPVHEVTLTQGFWMATTEVTQGLWESVMGSNPARFTGDPARPIETVSWNDVQTFLTELNEAYPGMGFRLPTEAEWEFACRAGSTTEYFFGDDAGLLVDYAWFIDDSEDTTHPVGQKLPNAWNLYDMTGNVWEWTEDWAGDYGAGPEVDPLGPSTGSDRTLRGACWFNGSTGCGTANRNDLDPNDTTDGIGFRLCR